MKLEDVFEIKRIMTPGELRFLRDSLSAVDKAGAVVNVGTYYGASAAALLVGMHEHGVTGPLFCIGTFRYHNAGGPKVKPFRERTDVVWSECFIEETERNLALFSEGKEVHVFECFSDDFPLSVVDGISLIFIDADHTVHGCLLDALKFSQKVVAGGLMLFHDYNGIRSVKEAVTTFTEIRQDFEVTGVHGSIAVVEKGAG